MGDTSQSPIAGISVGVQPRQKGRSVSVVPLDIGPSWGVLSETPHTFAQCPSLLLHFDNNETKIFFPPQKGVFCFLTVNAVKQISQLAAK